MDDLYNIDLFYMLQSCSLQHFFIFKDWSFTNWNILIGKHHYWIFKRPCYRASMPLSVGVYCPDMLQDFFFSGRETMDLSLSKAKSWLLSLVDGHKATQANCDNRSTKMVPVPTVNKTGDSSDKIGDMRQPMSYRWSIDSGCFHNINNRSRAETIDPCIRKNNPTKGDNCTREVFDQRMNHLEPAVGCNDSVEFEHGMRHNIKSKCDGALFSDKSKVKDLPYLTRLMQSIPKWVVTDESSGVCSSIDSHHSPRMSIQDDPDQICNKSLLSTADLLAQVHERLQNDMPPLTRQNSNVFDNKPCTKLSLQYFNSRQLRVGLLKIKSLNIKYKHVFAKTTLYHGQENKVCSKTFALRDLNKGSQDVLFDDVDLEHETNWTLRIKLYRKKALRLRRKCIGQVNIALDDFDLFLNTKVWCLLGKETEHQSKTMLQREEYYIVSADESISATARASLSRLDMVLNPSGSPSPNLIRHGLKRVNTAPCRKRNRTTDDLVPRNWSSTVKKMIN